MIVTTSLALALALAGTDAAAATTAMPWREAGLTERQAAAHLLDRFAYGARPGEVDRVVELGIERWLETQLAGALPDDQLDRRLAGFESLGLSTREIVARYPNPGLVRLQMMRDQETPGAGGGMRRPEEMSADDQAAMRAEIFAYARERGYRPQRELIGELYVQKLYRALYGENQLREVLTDFWLNHFNVSITDNDVRPYVLGYERDAIRPHVAGSFRAMLEATARHPAMLTYLDNARSVAEEGAPVTFDPERLRARRGRGARGGFGGRGAGVRGARAGRDDDPIARLLADRRPRGLNENYARELLELHTLGVDGGYGQDDVVAVARAFTGWTLYPPRALIDERMERRLRAARRLSGAGYVVEEEPGFIFRADAHDAGEKLVLGRKLKAGRGIEDGREVLDLLAYHPATARHLARKLAVRFVSDEPPAALVDRLAETFRESDGDLAAMIRTLARSSEFWHPAASRHRKIKSPFELAVSALRALDAEVTHPRALLEWIGRMGQPLYAYQAPTGYPDRADAWVNTGALLSRMNFGLELGSGAIPGVELDVLALTGGREPESLEDALAIYVALLLPERDPRETVERLEPVIRDPELGRKIADATPDAGISAADDGWDPLLDGGRERRFRPTRGPWAEPPAPEPQGTLGHVVGVILGSPEFQRR